MRFARNFILMSVMALLYMVFMPLSAFAAKNDPVALTPPPPQMFQTESFFDPSNKYLDQGRASIRDNMNQTASISVNTESKSNVSSLGGNVYLQKWTGTEWIDVGSGTTISTTNDWYFSGEVVKTTEKGYYFRARVIHWTSHQGVYEQGQTTTDYILAG